MRAQDVVLMVPGSLQTRTGGYIFDNRMVTGLRRLGWTVDVRELRDSFPFPDEAAIADASAQLRSVGRDRLVVVDGLALGALPEVATAVSRDLRLVALVHHPLAAETGLDAATAAALESSERRALAVVRRVIVTSPATAAALTSYGVPASRISVVLPGVDSAPLARGSRSGRVELLSVGSLTPRKGHDVLIRALAAVKSDRWHLTCVGSAERDPRTAAHLVHLIELFDLVSRIDLAGEADGSAVEAFYDRSDVFVLPTLYEGYGMAVAEALAHGLPVVSTRTGGIGDLVGDTAGVLVPAGDVASLADALRRIVDDAVFRISLAAGAARVRAQLASWDDAARTFAAALTEAAA